MTTLAQLEEQLNNLNALNKASARAIDAFADTSNAISVRAHQIIRDVKAWEVAQENIALTIEEMSKAARCYHPPPVLPAVLSGKDTSPEAVSRCIDYLVYTDDYLTSHPPNLYADDVQAKSEQQLRQIVTISEDLVKTALMNALQRAKGTADGGASGLGISPSMRSPSDRLSESPGGGHGGSGVNLIRNEKALLGIDAVIMRLRENFNRTEVIQNEVQKVLRDKMESLINAQFDGTYREEEVGKRNLSARNGIPTVMKHYQKGEHRLLKISTYARGLVEEVSRCLKTYVLTPLQDDYSVTDIPSTLAVAAFDIIFARAMRAVTFDVSLFANPTKLFVDARGQGVGLFSAARYFRDYVFIGLNLVEDFWQWKQLSGEISGENSTFVDHVDDQVDRFIYTVRELLDGYNNAKGALDKEMLKNFARYAQKTEWFPSVDCSVHESSANVLYFHKALLNSYFGALRIVLYGSVLGSNADHESVKEVEDYVMRGVLGTVQDLQSIGEAARELQEEIMGKNRHHIKEGSLHLLSSDVTFSPELFLINNLCFLMDNYRREGCFSKRVVPAPVTAETRKGKQPLASAATPPFLGDMFLYLEDEKVRCIDDFALSWEKCFPSLADDANMKSIDPKSAEALRKSQRMAVKLWHKEVSERLARKILDCRSEAIMDATSRARIIEDSVRIVRGQFELMQAILNGRAWSDRPQKWMPCTPFEWEAQVKSSF